MPGPLGNAIDTIVKNDLKTNKGKYSELSTDKFSINTKAYPANLGQQELNQFILFNINARGKSEITLGNEKKIAIVNRESVGSAQLSTQQLSIAKDVSITTAGALAGGLVGGKIADSSRKKFDEKKNRSGVEKSVQALKETAIKYGTGAAAALVAAGLSRFQENLKADTSYRITDAIALYINDPPSVKYSAQYSNKDLGTLAGIVGGVSGVDSLSGAASLTGESSAALLATFAKVPQALGVGSPADLIGASAKVGLNPFKEVLFESIDFRTFAFKYRFMPKSDWEANAVQDIIKLFKFHMHPEISQNKLFFIYPSEFEITYFYGGSQNQYFHKFKPCVLESLDVTYGGDQYSSFFNGKPTEVNLSLVFRETEILTKQHIKDGY